MECGLGRATLSECVLEQSACGVRAPMLAANSREDLAKVQLAVFVVPAGGAPESIRPAGLEQRMGAMPVCSGDPEEIPTLPLLALNLILRHS